MPFPVTEREVYQKNPLREVICQLRFPTILQVSAESPVQFQNAIRESYPLYSQEAPALSVPDTAGIPKEVATILAALPVPQGLVQPVHKFLTEDQTRQISLSQDFIALSEKRYISWKHFRREIDVAEKAFRDIYHPAFYSRIGLRYQDVVDRDELGLGDRPWVELLNSALIGVLGSVEVAGEIQDIRTQALLRLPEVPNGLVRVQHGLAKAPDGGRQVYLIDSDFYTQQRSELGDAFETLDVFNRWGGRLFRWAITPTLRRALEPRRIEGSL